MKHRWSLFNLVLLFFPLTCTERAIHLFIEEDLVYVCRKELAEETKKSILFHFYFQFRIRPNPNPKRHYISSFLLLKLFPQLIFFIQWKKRQNIFLTIVLSRQYQDNYRHFQKCKHFSIQKNLRRRISSMSFSAHERERKVILFNQENSSFQKDSKAAK